MGSIDREKVIKGLECCIEKLDTVVNLTHGFNCTACPYYQQCEAINSLVGLPMAKDALQLLKGDSDANYGVPTGARVLTLDELRALPDEPQVPLAMEERVPIGTWDGGSVVKWCGSLFIQEAYVDDGTLYTNTKTYGKFWRVWTAWPGKAKRKATPWTT